MTSVILASEAQPQLDTWLAQRGLGSPGAYKLGVVADDAIVAVVAFQQTNVRDVLLVAAADSPRWLSRGLLRLLASYVFEQLRCERVTTVIAKSNKRARRLAEGLGWTVEGTLRRHADDGGPSILYGLLRQDWRFGYMKEARDARPIAA
jgi:RimJ/RimL family protein N-acetyltransferase